MCSSTAAHPGASLPSRTIGDALGAVTGIPPAQDADRRTADPFDAGSWSVPG
jgi:hypothetical protein